MTPSKNPETNLALAPYIEHTLLLPDTADADIERVCKEAIQFKMKGVCVPSSFVSVAAQALQGSHVKLVSVIGFPLGHEISSSKAFEASEAVKLGAKEIDMVLAIGRLKAKQNDYVLNDIRSVVDCGVPVKVILETHLLSDEEICLACELAAQAGAKFVKTSTGFTGGGATVAHVELMKRAAGDFVEVKASGGIRTANQAWDLVRAGASRLGTSRSVEILTSNSSQIGDHDDSSSRTY